MVSASDSKQKLKSKVLRLSLLHYNDVAFLNTKKDHLHNKWALLLTIISTRIKDTSYLTNPARNSQVYQLLGLRRRGVTCSLMDESTFTCSSSLLNHFQGSVLMDIPYLLQCGCCLNQCQSLKALTPESRKIQTCTVNVDLALMLFLFNHLFNV